MNSDNASTASRATEARLFGTEWGTIPIWGDLANFSPERRLLVVIRGAFPHRDHMVDFPRSLPHLDVALVHLPGMHSPFLQATSIRHFARAFEAAFSQAFPGRQLNLLGVSAGGLAAMAIRGLKVRSIIALDTPLTTLGLWVMHEGLLASAGEDAALQDWIWQIFGTSRAQIEERDYRAILADLETPTRVLFGEEPLGQPRPIARMPSLVSEEDRAVYLEHPKIGTTIVGDAGHNLPRDGAGALYSIIYRWLGTPPG